MEQTIGPLLGIKSETPYADLQTLQILEIKENDNARSVETVPAHTNRVQKGELSQHKLNEQVIVVIGDG